MKAIPLIVIAALLALSACDNAPSKPAETPAQPSQPAAPQSERERLLEARAKQDARNVKAMNAYAAEVLARQEVPDDFVVVEHILIDSGGQNVDLKELEALAARILRESANETIFDEFKERYSKDESSMSADATYCLTRTQEIANAMREQRERVKFREEMLPGFWKVAFRLKVGEIAPLLNSQVESPFGWHIIRRVE
ncbi:MAG: peptidylprolyl isomerase [Planctomycetes bacterium]|nr:peptidylprolyl isomerase [Planctomycetota bacterium]